MQVIISHCNEQSLGDCIQSVEKQGCTPHLVSNSPFWKTYYDVLCLGETFEEEWFIFLGGDQVLLPDAIKKLIEVSHNVENNVFRISGMGYDYLHKRNRLMAPCLYRTSLVGIAKMEVKDKVRPERYVLTQMEEKGYPYIIRTDLVLAQHDMNQSIDDIYRKGYSQGQKVSKKYLKILIKTLSLEQGIEHKEFLRGLINGSKIK